MGWRETGNNVSYRVWWGHCPPHHDCRQEWGHLLQGKTLAPQKLRGGAHEPTPRDKHPRKRGSSYTCFQALCTGHSLSWFQACSPANSYLLYKTRVL